MGTIITILILAYLFSPSFRGKVKKLVDNPEGQKKEEPGQSQELDTPQDFFETIRQEYQENRDAAKSIRTKGKNQTIPVPQPTTPFRQGIEYERPPLDRLDIPEGGPQMEISKLQNNTNSHNASPILIDLLGNTEESRREQLRKAFILKEVFDRKY